MDMREQVAIITGGAGGIGQAVATELAHRGARGIGLVDCSENVLRIARVLNDRCGGPVVEGLVGDVTDDDFRRRCYDLISDRYGTPTICVPAAGITRDRLAVKVDGPTGTADVYPVEQFREVVEVNLLAPVYWALELIARIAEDRARRGLKRWGPDEGIQGTVVFIGSISSRGIPGQLAYSTTKAALEGTAATLAKEAMFHGVRATVIHPGFTDTPMVRSLGEEYIQAHILPHTQLKRLIRPEEIAEAIVFLISNPAVSGALWADAGWHPDA